MYPSFQYDLKGRVTAAGIVAVLLSVCIFMMPHLQTTLRNNKVFTLGVICMGLMAVLMLRYSLTGFLLLGYVSVSLFLSASETMGSAMYQILCYSGLFLLAMSTREHWREKVSWIYNAVCLIAIANVVAQTVQAFGVSFPKGLQPYAQHGFVGLMANVNETSALLAVCLPFFFRKNWAWVIPYIVGGLVMARTTNGMIAAVIITLIWLAVNYRRWFIVSVCYVAILALAGAYLLTVDRLDIANQLSGRGLIYKTTAIVSTIKPWGWGFGQYENVIPLLTHSGIMRKGNEVLIAYTFQQVSDKGALDRAVVRLSGETDTAKVRAWLADPANNSPSAFLQAHNEYLEFLFSTGYAGLIFLLAFLWRSLVRGFRRADKIPALALTASALTACLFFVWQIVPIAILTVLCLVLIHNKEQTT